MILFFLSLLKDGKYNNKTDVWASILYYRHAHTSDGISECKSWIEQLSHLKGGAGGCDTIFLKKENSIWLINGTNQDFEIN